LDPRSAPTSNGLHGPRVMKLLALEDYNRARELSIKLPRRRAYLALALSLNSVPAMPANVIVSGHLGPIGPIVLLHVESPLPRALEKSSFQVSMVGMSVQGLHMKLLCANFLIAVLLAIGEDGRLGLIAQQLAAVVSRSALLNKNVTAPWMTRLSKISTCLARRFGSSIWVATTAHAMIASGKIGVFGHHAQSIVEVARDIV